MRSQCAAIAAGLLVSVGCHSPCETGFERHSDGVCRAVQPCGNGTARDSDLRCHPFDGGPGSATFETDTGLSATDIPDDSGDYAQTDTGLYSAPAHVRIVMNRVAGFPLHGLVVLASDHPGSEPVASFCQVILDDPMDVEGFLVPYDGQSDPCPNAGVPFRFNRGEVELTMAISLGAAADPALCDTRTVTVGERTTVDYSDVTGCTP